MVLSLTGLEAPRGGKTRRWVSLAVLGLFFVTLGFGCKGLSQQERAAVKPVTLNYWTVFNDTEELKRLASEYRQLRPYVKVNIRQVRYEEFDRLFLNALADDVAPDVVSLHARWIKKYQNRLAEMPASVSTARLIVKGGLTKETQVVVDTTPMPGIGDIKRDYVGAVANDVIIGEAVYGLPIALDTLAIYYNKDLLDKANIAEPPATWDEFLEAVKKTTKFGPDGKIVQSGAALGTANNIDNAFDILSVLMMQNGVKMAAKGSVQFASGLDKAGETHPSLQALRFYTDFARPTKESYSWNETMEPALDAFVRGKAVFYFGFAYDSSRIPSRAPELNLEVIPLPQLNPSAPVNVANYWVEAVVKKSKHQNEAWDFIRFMTAPDQAKRYALSTGRPSAYRTQIKELADNPRLGPFVSQTLIAENWYHGEDITQAEKAFDDLITATLRPYADKDDPTKRDAGFIATAAQMAQQTF